MVRRPPLDDAERLVVPAQYMEPFQTASGDQAGGYRFQLPGESTGEGLLPFPLPPLRDPEPQLDEPRSRMTQPPTEVGAHRLTPELQQAADQYWQATLPPRRTGSSTAGKLGAAETEGLDFYHRVPGQVQFINGEPWIYDETSQREPWRRYTADHAYDPKTGQIYQAIGDVEQPPPLASNLSEIPDRAAYVAREAVVSPFVAFGRFMERAKLGLVAPRFVDTQEASIIAGAIQSGTAFGTLPRRAATAAEAEAGALTRGDLDRLGMERPPQRPSIESTLPDTLAPPPPPAPTSQYRTRPGGVRPQGHITTEEFTAQRRQAFLKSLEPETDEAGFYINALERAKRELPETATAAEMRQELRNMGIADAEVAMLGLDRFLLGESGVARERLRMMDQNLSRAANQLDLIRKKVGKHPDNSPYRDQLLERAETFRRTLEDAARTRKAARTQERGFMEVAVRQRRAAEATLKDINSKIRKAREAGQEPDVSLLSARQLARSSVDKTQKALEAARANDPGLRTVTRAEIVKHIRENRPRLGLEVRRYPEQQFGEMTGPINRIKNPNPEESHPLEVQLARRGVDLRTASDIAADFANMNPTEWGQRAEALSSHYRNPHMVREALEEAAGASLADMVRAWRATSTYTGPNVNAPRPPMYKSAIPDGNNPTMQEIAVILKGPWDVRGELRKRIKQTDAEAYAVSEQALADGVSEADATRLNERYDQLMDQSRQLERERNAAPAPPFTSGHWSDDVAPIGHMQVSIQRAPVSSPRADRQAEIARGRIAELERRKLEINTRMQQIGDAHPHGSGPLPQEWYDLNRQTYRIDDKIKKVETTIPQANPSRETIYMGNQFQSDWSTSGMTGFRSPESQAKIEALKTRLEALRDETANLEGQLTRLSRAALREGNAPGPPRQAQRDALRDAIHDNADRMAVIENQISELEKAPTGHALVENIRAWLRPMLEMFVDEAIKAKATYMGVPSGATVRRWNPASEGTVELYDQALRRELRFVLERRFGKHHNGRETYSEREINTMYSHNGRQSFTGQWYLIPTPQNVRGGRGVRVMQGGAPVPPDVREMEDQ